MKKFYLTLFTLITAIFCMAGYNSSYSESQGLSGGGVVEDADTVYVNDYYRTFNYTIDLATNYLGNPSATANTYIFYSGGNKSAAEYTTTSRFISNIIDLNYNRYIVRVTTYAKAITDPGSNGVAQATVNVSW
jgi:hypothetical protein